MIARKRELETIIALCLIPRGEDELHPNFNSMLYAYCKYFPIHKKNYLRTYKWLDTLLFVSVDLASKILSKLA